MKKALCITLALIVLMGTIPALGAGQYDPKYTMGIEGVLLQNSEDRKIQPAEDAMEVNPVIEGESPTTGEAYDTDSLYMPMLVQISNPTGSVTVNRKTIEAAGIGKYAPWSGQYADIVYEAILYRTGQTRITFVFSDSLADSLPKYVGPVRSARYGHALLREEWQGGIVFAGGPDDDTNDYSIVSYFKKLGATDKGVVFDLTHTNKYNSYKFRAKYKNKKDSSVDNLCIDLIGLRDTIPETTIAQPHPFLFDDISPYTDGYEFAYSINLDWGHSDYISHLYYDETENLYLRYSGNAPYMTWLTLEARESANTDEQEQMAFSNVIIQRVDYDYDIGSSVRPIMKAVGKGNADIFIGGRYIPGYWIRESVESPTVFLDDQGNEIILTRGKTYIAHMPTGAVLTYQGIQ